MCVNRVGHIGEQAECSKVLVWKNEAKLFMNE